MSVTENIPDKPEGGEETLLALQELRYLRRVSERNIAKIMALEAQSIAIRYELEHKRRGFALLAELVVSLRNHASYEDVFVPAARRINATLNMQRTAVLVSDGDGGFLPAVLQGYPADRREIVASRRIVPDAELLNPERPVLLNGGDPASRLSAFREAVEIPYFVSAPIPLYDGTVGAILVTGRMVEEPPFLSRLGQSIVEAVSAISALMGALLVEQNLTNELRRARDQAEKSARAKGEFLANVSHEVRTPINAILGMIRLLDKSDMTGEQQRLLDQADHSTRLLLRIFDDIMDFSNIDTGRMTLRPAEFNVRETVKNACASVTEQALSKSLTLSVNVAPGVPDVIIGDAIRLEQTLLNLAGNAVKFTQEGRVDIRVTCEERQERPGKIRLLFEVEDTGIGISEEQMAGLFLPFTQADTSHTRKYGGTGLGLAISRSLVELMQGEIRCESRLGEGSNFSFSVEFAVPAAQEPAASRENDEHGAFSGLEGMRVLLAEDNEINQIVAESVLAEMGVSVTIAANGLEAVKALEVSDYDLVLMDIQMPEMDGLAATTKIRTKPEFKDLPIIALTAHSQPEDRELSLRTGMNEHLTKPLEPDRIYKILKHFNQTHNQPHNQSK